jgi:glutamate racemase
MKIGIFDSGLGGLIITHALTKDLPEYDYVYLGDTARVPYGNRTQAEIYQFTEEAMAFLFSKDCKLVIVACNTASAEALRKIQQRYVPKNWPDRKVLGVLIPSAEEAVSMGKKIGVIATQTTIDSGAFDRELLKLNKEIEIIKKATPLLVPIIERGDIDEAKQILGEYLADIKNEIDTLILGSTHYIRLKKEAQQIVGKDTRVVSQDSVIPKKLKNYLLCHPEIETILTRNCIREYFVTKETATYGLFAKELMGEVVDLKQVSL